MQQACRLLQSARLETLATRLPGRGGLHDLAVDAPTRDELEALAARCRYRERLAAAQRRGRAGQRRRACAARPATAAPARRWPRACSPPTLGKDLYRVDLSAAVNKYLGETEKNLHHAFSAAEELDVVLLLDEGDALMAGRTDVGSSNDRYANLETNFLLQRIESFDGILLVTTNAADRIDKAFSRRMDVVINFRPPDEWRRYDILKLHLGAEASGAPDEIDDDWLQQMAVSLRADRRPAAQRRVARAAAGAAGGGRHAHRAPARGAAARVPQDRRQLPAAACRRGAARVAT